MNGLEVAGFAITVALGAGWLGFVAASVQRRHAQNAALASARAEYEKIVSDDQAWKPAHMIARAETIFAQIEAARAAGDIKLLNGLATPAGEEAIRQTLWVAGAMRPEPRELTYAAIALTEDRPGILDDKAWIHVHGIETKCQEAFEELWRLTRAGTGGWLLDAVETDSHQVELAVRRR